MFDRVTVFAIFAFYALAKLWATHSVLETLAVLFLTIGLRTVASLFVSTRVHSPTLLFLHFPSKGIRVSPFDLIDSLFPFEEVVFIIPARSAITRDPAYVASGEALAVKLQTHRFFAVTCHTLLRILYKVLVGNSDFRLNICWRHMFRVDN